MRPCAARKPTGSRVSEDDEIARIRAVYARWDERGLRSGPIQEASRRLGAERHAITLRLLQGLLPDIEHPRILDVGCGSGGDLSYFQSIGWAADRLAGVDLLSSRLEAARVACPGVDLQLTHGSELPFPDGSFEVATASTVFSSILDIATRRALFAEMERVVCSGGLVLIYDFIVRKPTNSSVIAMPLQRLAELGRPPDGSVRVSPLLHAVAAGSAVHRRLADVAMRTVVRTHRLSYWRKPSGAD